MRDAAAGYIFIAPAAVLIGVFGIFPAFFTLYVSLFRWRLRKGDFIGWGNYATLFGNTAQCLLLVAASIAGFVLSAMCLRRRNRRGGPLFLACGLLLMAASLAGLILFLPSLASRGDTEVYDSLRVTVWYCLGTVPIQLAAGLLLASFLMRKVWGKQAFRVAYLLPYIAPTVATAAVFELLFSLRPDSLANQILRIFGGAPLQWLQEPRGIFSLILGASPQAGASSGSVAAYWMQWGQGPSLALAAVMAYSWWVFAGYYALIYINGLANIPRQLYEAAEVDGAGPVRRFFSITVPLLSPTTYFLTLLGVIGTFKAFTHLFVLRTPAALGTTDPISVEIFFRFFRKANLGYASAQSLFLFVIVAGLTILQSRALRRGVAYGD